MCGKKYIIYNPYARMGKCKEDAEILEVVYDNTVLVNMEKISSYKVFFDGMEKEDEVILCGGDGTLNYFANAVREIDISNDIYFYSVGYGYDFVQDLGLEKEQNPDFLINCYLKRLPTLIVNGTERLFLNGIGFGVDSECWKIQESMFEKNGKENRKSHLKTCFQILKGAFSFYHPTKASICVDKKEYRYENVWMAPTMFGRFYNAGLIPAPKQNRMEDMQQLSIMILQGCGRWKAFFVYLSLYKGKHEKYRKYVKILSGNKIRVSFDRPASLVVDGEILNNVTGYSVSI